MNKEGNMRKSNRSKSRNWQKSDKSNLVNSQVVITRDKPAASSAVINTHNLEGQQSIQVIENWLRRSPPIPYIQALRHQLIMQNQQL